jgi:DNA-binding transcriptional LysR family regulator
METAQRESVAPKHAHNVMAPQEAVDLVSDDMGIAILAQPMVRGFHPAGVVVKPLSDTSLCFETCVIMRADNDSRLVNEYVRSFLRKYAPQRLPPKRIELSLSARVVRMKKAVGPARR